MDKQKIRGYTQAETRDPKQETADNKNILFWNAPEIQILTNGSTHGGLDPTPESFDGSVTPLS
jgi:hypothetical protein